MGLDELYQEIIFDHYKKPRNHGSLANPDVTIDGKNPFCGDEVKLSLKVENNLVTDIAFEGTGCAISQASVSIMTCRTKAKSMMIHAFAREIYSQVKIQEIREMMDKLVLSHLEGEHLKHSDKSGV